MTFIFKNLFSSKSITYKILFYTVIFFFLSLGILIQYLTLTSLDKKIKKIHLDVEEQKELHSIYQILKSNEQRKVPLLPVVLNGKISRDRIESLPGNIRDIARKVNMDMIFITPDMNSISPDSRYLLVSMGIRGDFFNFRNFLTNLGSLAFLDRIEEIQIQEKADVMEFRLKIRLAMI